MKDLTQGSIARHLIALAVPTAAGMLFQTLYYFVDLYFVAALGDEVFRLSMLEEGVFATGEERLNVPTQRRDPDRVPRVELVRKVDEAFEVPPVARRSDAQAFGQMTPSSLPIDANCSRQLHWAE